MDSNSISAVINTYNASLYLEEVLRHLTTFDEIVVCDMESTDNTLDIARRYGCKIVTFPRGEYRLPEPARETAVAAASSEWVLVVDDDEIIPAELAEKIKSFVKAPTHDAMYIPRLNWMIGNRPTATYPDYQLRLMRRRALRHWPSTVHPTPAIEGTIGHFPRADRHHLAMQHKPETMSAHYVKMCRYTDAEVTRRVARGEGSPSYLKILLSPAVRFLRSFVLKGGFHRGIPGLLDAGASAVYKFVTLSKLYEHYLPAEKKGKTPQATPRSEGA